MLLNKIYKINIAVFAALLVGFLIIALLPREAFAACEPNYGGGENCTFEKTFKIRKKVRIEGDDSWKDKVTDVKKGEVVEFRIEIQNTGEIEVDKMKMSDNLPDELNKTGGSGLTEEWDNFEPGESKRFIIKAKINDSEFDTKNFEKCIVNEAKAKQDKKDVGSDSATVCYGNGTITELPKTGAESNMILGLVGAGLVSLGLFVKKFKLN